VSLNVALVDYGAGNLTSVVKGFHAAGAEVRIVGTAAGLDAGDAVVIPGVGHFSATATLDAAWRAAVTRAIEAGVPVLGICLGLQWLFDGSDESPGQPGLGLISGTCFRLTGDVKVPHIGWNTLRATERPSRILQGIPKDASAYFTHSYAAPLGPDTAAETMHGVPFASAVERGRTFGVQFHPEKSGPTGLRMLSNFLDVVREAR
jgi:imidazole glycerol-phosphate synthase subunit HisH